MTSPLIVQAYARYLWVVDIVTSMVPTGGSPVLPPPEYRVPDVYWNQAEMELATKQATVGEPGSLRRAWHEGYTARSKGGVALGFTCPYEPVEATDRRPHSRACGIAFHYHGPQCSKDCPTCGGRDRKGEHGV